MSIKIDRERCNGCGLAEEALCERICPGNLLFRGEDGRAAIRDARDCWGCAACVKECPQQAIHMYLPMQIGGRGSTLTARKKGHEILWTLRRPDGSEELFRIINERPEAVVNHTGAGGS